MEDALRLEIASFVIIVVASTILLTTLNVCSNAVCYSSTI
jgi:hypothetical protein